MTSEDFRARIQPALDRQANSIPQEVRLSADSAPPARSPPTRFSYTPDSVIRFPESCKLLSSEELKITQFSAGELVKLIASGELTSEACTRAFIKRAGIATQLVNCCTEIVADAAIARAQELDDYLKTHGKPIGPLHGLPVSIKEHVLWKDRVVHCSYVAWLDNVEPENGLVLQVMIDCGAIPFCRTTQPQSVMQLETNSNIYGHTLNPYNRQCTAGGSSGGESALLALHGSPLGLGGDIGGSIRNPASLCGLYGLKPTSLRVPTGTKGLHKGRETVLGVNGPLCHKREDLELWMSSVLSTEPWLREPSIIPLPWRPTTTKKENLTVAVMWDDGVVQPLPPVARALRQVCKSLLDAGIKLISWEPKDHAESWSLISRLYYPNNAEDEKAMFAQGGEKMLPLTEWLFTQPGIKNHSFDETDALIIARNAYRTSYARHWLDQEAAHGHPIDVILCPAAPGPAPKLGTSKYWTYTSIWNLLDYPAAVFPVTEVSWVDRADGEDSDEESDEEGDKKGDEKGDKKGDKKGDDPIVPNDIEKEIWENYNQRESMDMPIGLQVVGRRYQEEKLLADLAAIELAMNTKWNASAIPVPVVKKRSHRHRHR